MIELKNISKTYQMGQIAVHALRDVSITIEEGEFVAIMGASGSGKSTLMHVLGLLDEPDTGSYTFYGDEVTTLKDSQRAVLRNQLAGFVFQQFHLLPRISACENAELPLIYAGKRKLKARAQEKIAAVGLANRAEHQPNELSGGEQQRVAIARALVNEPMIILADEPTGNLDTKSEAEILAILKQLNDAGITIIMVTHEQEMAQFAKRIVTMRDGVITSDETRDPRRAVLPEGQHRSIQSVLETADRDTSRAEWYDHLRQAFNSIFSNKMRSALSGLGILIGVAAVIAMLALGEGAKESIKQQLSSLGSNLLTVRPGAQRQQGVAMQAGTTTRFTLQDADAMAQLPTIARVSATVSGRGQLIYGNKNWNSSIQGTGESYPQMRASEPQSGRFFTHQELQTRQKVAVIGMTVAKELFGDTDPVDSTIKINRVSFRVVGVLPAKGATGWRDQDDVVIVPVTTAMYRLLGKEYVDSIDVEVKSSQLMAQAQEEIKQLVISRHHLTKKEEESFQVRDMSEIQQVMTGMTQTMTWLLGSIAAISLLVGGIGIMNIMLVSVTERTREIGLRKALGAQSKDIMTQFLIEAIVLTVSGGIMGILLGAGIASLLSLLAGWATKVSAISVIMATTFSISVGVSFGLWPAYKASKLNPVEALRYE
ncbi:MAG: ABC transporter permease [Candidatus Margulisiibacteriota bacterium]